MTSSGLLKADAVAHDDDDDDHGDILFLSYC